jgi:hypothetical protein
VLVHRGGALGPVRATIEVEALHTV